MSQREGQLRRWQPGQALPNTIILDGVELGDVRVLFDNFPVDRVVHFIIVRSNEDVQAEIEQMALENLSPILTSYLHEEIIDDLDDLSSSVFDGMISPHVVMYYRPEFG